MASTSYENTEDSVHHGVFPDLAHCDLLCFLSVAQELRSTFLEYTPKYNRDAIRTGGNTLVELIYIDSNRPTLQFAFKRTDNNAGLDKQAKYRKLICELAVYDHALLKKHPNITNLTGITWSIASNPKLRATESSPIWPVLGFQPSQRGHLGNLFDSKEKSNLSLTQRFQLCIDIGHGLEALHALNIVHGDLKPENVVIFEEHSRLVAKLIDFDCSSFGLADDSQVSVVGTPGWIAPECARRNARFCLRDARKSDIYTYAKLCAWIIFGPEAEINNFIVNPGRIYDPVHETFDILGALQALEHNLSDGEDEEHRRQLTSLGSAYTSLHRFFDSCFLGNPEAREDSISKAAALLEKAMSEMQDLNLSIETGDQVGRNPSSAARRLRSLRASCSGTDAEPLTFLDKQKLLLWRQTFRRYVIDRFLVPLHMISVWTLMIMMIVCDILVLKYDYYLEVAQGKHPEASILDFLVFLGAVFSIIILPGILLLPVIYCCCRPLYNALTRGNEDDLFEDQEPYSSTNSDELALIQRSNSVLLSQINGFHALPEMSCLFPLLNRLHYRARIEVVNELLERKKCPACQIEAGRVLSELTTMAFGSLRHTSGLDTGALEPDIVNPSTLRSFEQWDANYEATLPDLPREIISSLQDHRLDQYSFQELPEAILTIFSEIDGKASRNSPLRSTQILYIALSRLCTLIGRYEEAEICCRNAMRHINPKRWRAPQDFVRRAGEAMTNVERKWEHRRDVKRRQLQEREQNLFKFSLVDILEVQGEIDEAIDILQAIPDITNAPNGHYYEQEPGHTLWTRETRLHDARNLLIGLLITQNRLDVVKRIDQHLDLADATKYYESWDNKVTDCFANTTKMATAYYSKGRYHEASQLQRDRLRLSLAHFKGDRGRINQARRDLALSLSHSENRKRILEARKYQDWLIRHTEDGDLQMSQIRLNRAFTIVQLGDTAEGLKQVQEVMRSARKTSDNQGEELLTVHLCSEPTYTLGSQRLIQNAFLRLCTIAPSEELTFRLVSLLCTRMTESPIIDVGNNLKDVLKLCLDHKSTSRSWPMRILFLDRSLWFMCENGCSKKNIDLLNEAIGLANITLNEAVIIGLTLGDMERLQRIVSAVYTKKALFLYRNQGFGVHDVEFLHEALQKQRSMGKGLCRDDRGLGNLQRDLASLLTEHGASFHDTACISEAIGIYEDLLRNERRKKAFDSDKLMHSHMRAELCHARQIIEAFQCDSAAEDSVNQTLEILKVVKAQLESASECSILVESLLAQNFESDGQIEIARQLHDTLFTNISNIRGKDHPDTLNVEKALLLFRSRHNKHHYEYLSAFSRLRYTALRIYGPTHFSFIEYLSCYADALHSDPMAIDEAINLKRKVLGEYENIFGPAHTRTVDSSSQLAWMLCQRGGCDYAEGIEFYQQCLASAATLFGPENPRTVKIWEAIMSQKLVHPEKDLDRLTQKVADALRDFLIDNDGISVSQGIRPAEDPIRLATNVVISTQILGGSHSFTTRQVDRFKLEISTYGLLEQDLESVQACVQGLISNEIPAFLQPPAKELGLQWVVIREGLSALKERDDETPKQRFMESLS